MARAALSDFDGRKWSNVAGAPEMLHVERDGSVIFAGTPEVLNVKASPCDPHCHANYRLGVSDGLRYDVYSSRNLRHLDRAIPEAIRALALDMAAGQIAVHDRARAIEAPAARRHLLLLESRAL